MAVRTAMGCQIGALPCTPFASSRRSPQGETRSMERKNSESYTSRTISAFSPFGGERSEPVSRMLNMPYDTEGQSRNADFISIARRAIHNPRPEGPSNLRTLRPIGPVNLKNLFHNLFPQPFYTTRGASRAPLFFNLCPKGATTTLGLKGRQT